MSMVNQHGGSLDKQSLWKVKSALPLAFFLYNAGEIFIQTVKKKDGLLNKLESFLVSILSLIFEKLLKIVCNLFGEEYVHVSNW